MYRKLLRDHSTTTRAPHRRIGVATHPLKLAHTLHTAQQVCARLEHLPQSADKRVTHRKAANYPKLTTCLWASSHTTHIASRAASTTLFIESSCFSSSTFRCSSCCLSSPPDNCSDSTCLAVTCQSRSTKQIDLAPSSAPGFHLDCTHVSLKDRSDHTARLRHQFCARGATSPENSNSELVRGCVQLVSTVYLVPHRSRSTPWPSCWSQTKVPS